MDLAKKLMQFAEMNLENYQIERRKRDQKQAEKEKDKLKKVTDIIEEPEKTEVKKLRVPASLVQPVSFEMNCQLLRGFGPPVMLQNHMKL